VTTTGDRLSPFELRNQNDFMARHSDLRDHWMVLTCHPRDMTLGCSQEALS